MKKFSMTLEEIHKDILNLKKHFISTYEQLNDRMSSMERYFNNKNYEYIKSLEEKLLNKISKLSRRIYLIEMKKIKKVKSKKVKEK